MENDGLIVEYSCIEFGCTYTSNLTPREIDIIGDSFGFHRWLPGRAIRLFKEAVIAHFQNLLPRNKK